MSKSTEKWYDSDNVFVGGLTLALILVFGLVVLGAILEDRNKRDICKTAIAAGNQPAIEKLCGDSSQ